MEHDALEREVKLEVGVGFRIPDFEGIALGVSAVSEPDQRLQAVYVDTPDLRLIRSGYTLRHRSDRSVRTTGEWTLKIPADAAGPGLTRRELSWPGKWGPVPAEVSGLVRAVRRSAALGPVARLLTHRRRTVLLDRSGERLLEIDDDVVSVMDGRKLAARFREVEVEVVGPASAALLDGVVYRLAEAGAVAGDGRAKLARAIGPRAAEAADVSPVPIDRDASMAEVIRAAVSHGYLRLVAHDPGIRLDEDPEDVHQARVATRRLRSDLRTFRAFLPADWNAETREELGWLADALGRTRDADVLLERLHRQMESLETRDAAAAGAIIGRLVEDRARDRDALLAILNSERYGRLLDRLAAAARELPAMKIAEESVLAAPVAPWAPEPAPVEVTPAPLANGATPSAPAPDDTPVPVIAAASDPSVPLAAAVVAGPVPAVPQPVPEPPVVFPVYPTTPLPPPAPVPPPPPDRDSPARKLAPSVVSTPWKHLSRAVADLGPEPEDEALHEVRIRAKRLRYACEAVAGVAGRPAVAMGRAAADLQGILGDFHDAIVAADWLREASAGATLPQALAAGQLIGMERQDASHCRDAWADAWDRLDRKKLRAWLH